MGNLTKGSSYASAGLGIAMDLASVFLKDENGNRLESWTKFGINTAFNVGSNLPGEIGELAGPVAGPAAVIYFGVDALYPAGGYYQSGEYQAGGWEGLIHDTKSAASEEWNKINSGIRNVYSPPGYQ